MTEIILNELQKKAVEMACKNRFFVLTGGPGTGKTTAVISIIRAFGDSDIAILAPTGKAAKRASEVTGLNAMTIHRFIGTVRARIARGEHHGIPRVVIIDECSMVDASLFGALICLLDNYRKKDIRVIMIGDVDQLPSIGAGRVLADIIESGRVPVVRLVEIMRQADDSLIVSNARCINDGRGAEVKNGSDFEIITGDDHEFLIDRIRDSLKEATGRGLDIYNDIQVLVGQKRSELGAESLNAIIRNVYNPPHRKKAEMIGYGGQSLFRVGDKVLCTENDYELGVVNGDQGIVKHISQLSNGQYSITVTIDDRDVVFTDDQIDSLMQAWAMTVHRSQGSEYPLVLVVMHSGLMAWSMQRALVYTAITRAKNQVKVFCREGDLALASRKANIHRDTRLGALLRSGRSLK